MAAPMESESSEENTDETDPLSDSFDPFKALYSPKIKVPIPDAKQFNNLAEFENFINKKDAKSQVLKKKEKLPGIIAQRAAMQAREAVRKASILSKSSHPKESSLTQQRRQRSTNVLTNMERFEKGPLSILRRCVSERLRVIVVVRAAVSVRSHCRGYIVAFDKHMNMALMDVDEKYIRPVVLKPADKEELKKNKDKTSASETNPIDKDSSRGVTGQEFVSQCSVKGSSAGGDLRDRLKGLTKANESRHISDGKHAMSDSDVKKDRVKSSDKQTKSQSDSESQKRQEMGDIGIDIKKTAKKKQPFTPFWPLYKKWTENRCYASYEIIDRHINQLFVRGDNVVSVSIAH